MWVKTSMRIGLSSRCRMHCSRLCGPPRLGQLTAVEAQKREDLLPQVLEARKLLRLQLIPRARKVHVQLRDHPGRSLREHQHAVRQQDRLLDVVGHEEDREPER